MLVRKFFFSFCEVSVYILARWKSGITSSYVLLEYASGYFKFISGSYAEERLEKLNAIGLLMRRLTY